MHRQLSYWHLCNKTKRILCALPTKVNQSSEKTEEINSSLETETMLKPISSCNEQIACQTNFSPIRLGIKALDITTALNMIQWMASVKLFNKLTGISKLWGLLAFQHFTTVNASLLLPRRVEVLEDNFAEFRGASARDSAVGRNRLAPSLQEWSW